MEKDWKGYRLIAIEFSKWLKAETVDCGNGYMLCEGVGEYDGTEYQVDELYDYWFENVLTPFLNS